MKKILLIVSLFFLSIHLYAERVDRNTAMKVANTVIEKVDFELVATRSHNNFYIFSNDNSFVIVSADDRVKPIIGYSDSNPFVISESMTNVNYWLNRVDEQIQYVIDNNIKATAEIQNEWNTLLSGNKLTPKNRASVDALLTTLWDQDAPFNNMCPSYYGTPTVTGCAATAMAQVMKYWNWPKTGTGSKSYNEPTFGTLSVNFGNTSYDWENMKDDYRYSYNSTEANAVATLMYHCGVSIEMQYGTDGSGASPGYIRGSLSDYFDYNSATLKEDWKEYSDYGYVYYSDSEWKSLLKTELNAERPIIYNGYDISGGGHSFVCDGYDASDNFHFNWGWSGYCDGYFEIGLLSPGAGGIGSGPGAYNEDNYIIYGIEPNPENYTTDAYTFVGNGSWNTPSNWKGLDGNTLTSLPNFSDKNVIINGTAVIGNGIDAEVANLTIKSSKTLTIADGGTLTVNEKAVNSNFDALIIEEGAQVFVANENVAATFKKDIANPDNWGTDHNEGWQFISSPLKNTNVSDFVPLIGDYDLFKYDGTQELQWQNHKDYGSNNLSDFTYYFDEGFDGWTTIDGDGDGHTLFHSDDCAAHLGYSADELGLPNGCIVGESTCYNYLQSYLYPNDYLVAPKKFHIEEGAKISFYVVSLAQDAYAESFGIAVSTTGNTSPEDFTTIIGWNVPGSGAWYLCETDLNAYAGLDVWIAIHHYTPSPQWFFFIDDLTITAQGHDFEDTFEQGRGYLASYELETTAKFKGHLNPGTSFNFPVTYNANNRWNNFHILGNPFTFDINWSNFTKSNVVNGIARMKTDGSYKYDVSGDIKVGEGFMIMTKGTNPSLRYGSRSYEERHDNINIIAKGTEGSDNVMIHFNGEDNEGFPKLDNFNENIANVFVQRDGSRYGICSYNTDVTEIPIYFDAKEMGSYSLAIEADGKFDNVYLYDRKTGETIDMLSEKEYRFTSTENENPERFVLKFNLTKDAIEDNFVYQSGENLYINAEGTIQIIDIMGRVVYSNDVESSNNVINISNLNKATYLVRNINENQVRIQKIVIL